MPISSRLDDGVIVVELSGEYPLEAMMVALLDALNTHASSGPVRILFDQRRSTILERRSDDELKELANFADGIGAMFSPRVAFVVSREKEFEKARSGISLVTSQGMASDIFLDVESARAWLLEIE